MRKVEETRPGSRWTCRMEWGKEGRRWRERIGNEREEEGDEWGSGGQDNEGKVGEERGSKGGL